MNHGLADRIIMWTADNVLPWVLIALGVGVTLFIIGLAIFGVYQYFFPGRAEPLVGIICRKTHRPAYTSTVLVASGKTMIPVTQYHPECWDFVIQEEGTTGDENQQLVDVDEDVFNRHTVGDIWRQLQQS